VWLQAPPPQLLTLQPLPAPQRRHPHVTQSPPATQTQLPPASAVRVPVLAVPLVVSPVQPS